VAKSFLGVVVSLARGHAGECGCAECGAYAQGADVALKAVKTYAAHRKGRTARKPRALKAKPSSGPVIDVEWSEDK